MKKIVCIFLTAALLLCCACSAQTEEKPRELVSFSESERLLLYRYYYVLIWQNVCDNSGSGVRFGLGDLFDISLPPDEQYYMPEDGSEKYLWSQHLAIAAAGQTNEILCFYDDAIANGYVLSDERMAQLDEEMNKLTSEANRRSMTELEIIAEKFGADFSRDMYKKALTAQGVLTDYSDSIIKQYIEKYTPEKVIYEQCSELAQEDFKEFAYELKQSYEHKLYEDTAGAIKEKETALTLIKAEIARVNGGE